MIGLDIPGYGRVTIRHLVCDFNGTLALDGKLLPDVRELLGKLSVSMEIHVLTADTFGAAREQLRGLPCTVTILPEENQDTAKADYVRQLGGESTICVGNGRNDRLMMQEALVGIAVIQEEGAAAATLQSADVVCRSVQDAVSLLLNTTRMVATLRS
jgi:P-type E1-E2 ATPase